MRAPIFIRRLTENERQQIQARLRSLDAFVLYRCQILLTSARGERTIALAQQLECEDQTVRNMIHSFNTRSPWFNLIEPNVGAREVSGG